MQEDDHVRVQVGDHLLSHLFSHDARSSSSNCCCARSRSSSVPLMVSRLTRRDSLLGLFSGTRRMRRPLCATSTNSPCNTRSTIWKRFLRNSVLVTFMTKVYRINVHHVQLSCTHMVRMCPPAPLQVRSWQAEAPAPPYCGRSGKPTSSSSPGSGATPRIPWFECPG